MARSVFLGAGSDQSLNTTDSPTFAGLTVTGRALLKQATVTLTDAQIKTLAATSITIIPAPGVGKGIMVIGGALKFNISDGYETLTDPYFVLHYFDSPVLQASARVSGVPLEGDNTSTALLLGFGQITPFTGDIALINQTSIDPSNLAIQLSAAGIANPLTGGNAANTLRVSIFYLVQNLTTGLYE